MNEEYKRILSWMSDEESRDIYEKRVKFQETYDYKYIQYTIDKYLKKYRDKKWLYLSDVLRNELKGFSQVIVAGAGQKGKALVVLLKNEGFNVSSVIDSYVKCQLTFGGINVEVSQPDKADYSNSCVLVSLSDRSVAETVKQNIVNCGCDESRVFMLADYVCAAEHYKEIEYFDEKILGAESHETFVDCGALDMETSKFFTERWFNRGRTKHITIHAFEPDIKNYERCCLEQDGFNPNTTTVNISNMVFGVRTVE